MPRASLLLLADGRFPAGGHAHSAGVEAACASGGIVDVAGLQRFVDERLRTAGRVEAAFAAAAATGAHDWAALDGALDARMLSPALRDASRALGRQALRAGGHVWPHPVLVSLRAASPPGGPHQALAVGALAVAAGLAPIDAAYCTLHNLASSCATAAVRLLGLDPYRVHRVLADLAPVVDELAREAETGAGAAPHALPATSGPLVEILAEDHATWEVRLFAS